MSRFNLLRKLRIALGAVLLASFSLPVLVSSTTAGAVTPLYKVISSFGTGWSVDGALIGSTMWSTSIGSGNIVPTDINTGVAGSGISNRPSGAPAYIDNQWPYTNNLVGEGNTLFDFRPFSTSGSLINVSTRSTSADIAPAYYYRYADAIDDGTYILATGYPINYPTPGVIRILRVGTGAKLTVNTPLASAPDSICTTASPSDSLRTYYVGFRDGSRGAGEIMKFTVDTSTNTASAVSWLNLGDPTFQTGPINVQVACDSNYLYASNGSKIIKVPVASPTNTTSVSLTSSGCGAFTSTTGTIMTNGSLIFQMCGTKVVEVNASDLAVVGLVKNAAGTADLSSILGIRYMGGTFWAFGNGGFKSLGPDKTVPAITLAADKSSLVYGDSQDLTATVTDSSGAFLPTGTVTWTKVSGPSSQTLCADTTLNGSGVATCHLVVPLAGSYTLTARYNGDTSLAAVTSTSSSFTVTKATPSIVVDDVAQNFTAYTMPTDGVVFTAHVTGAVGAVQPGGYVGWMINGPDGTSIYECTSEVALTNNEATCTLTGSSPWTVGFYQVTAYYMGTSGSDPNYVTGGPPDWGSIKVENEGTTSAFTVSPNSVTLGSRPTLNGELSYTSGAGPTGTVNYTITFPDGSQQVGCTLTLSGSASSPIGTPCEAPAFNMAGNYTIRMEYYGDSNYSSSFDSQTLVVSPYALTLGAPTADPTSAVASGVTTITFTAPALTAPSGALDPSGVITWTISGTAGAQSCLSEANVVGSPLTCTVDVSNAGTVTATYTYGGDQNYASGTSTSGSMTIQSPPAPTGSGSGSCALHSSVFFATNSAQLNADNILSVASVAEQIVNCHLTRILVTGYTDGWGSRSTNAALSAARATTVASLLKKDLKGFGVRDVTVTARGMGIATGSMSDSLKRHAIIGRL